MFHSVNPTNARLNTNTLLNRCLFLLTKSSAISNGTNPINNKTDRPRAGQAILNKIPVNMFRRIGPGQGTLVGVV